LNDTVPELPKPAPMIVTLLPTGPDVGETLVMEGACAVKFAMTLSVPLTVKYCGLAVPPRLPLNPEKTYPLAGVALTCTTEPLVYHPLAGEMVPPPAGLTVVVR